MLQFSKEIYWYHHNQQFLFKIKRKQWKWHSCTNFLDCFLFLATAEPNRPNRWFWWCCHSTPIFSMFLSMYRSSICLVVIFAHHCSKHTREICNLLGHSRGKKLTTVILHTREESKITTYFMQFSFVVIFKDLVTGFKFTDEIPLHSNVFVRF